jgi:hypothetical protein
MILYDREYRKRNNIDIINIINLLLNWLFRVLDGVREKVRKNKIFIKTIVIVFWRYNKNFNNNITRIITRYNKSFKIIN